jgi:high-affinity iron transporter
MFKIALVVFRECVEIALLLGIIMAITKRIENSRLYVIAGSMLGLIGASLFAFFTQYISISFAGMGDEIFDAAIILITVALIIWTIVWMRDYESKLKMTFGDISTDEEKSFRNKLLLVLVVASTILREGTEIILLVYGISSAEKINIDNYLIGLGIGALCGLFFGTLIYQGLTKFAGKYIFKISFILLMLIAAGFASQAAGKLISADIIHSFSDQVWDSSWLVSDFSTIGKFLNATTGYTAKPTGMQIIFYIATIGSVLLLSKVKRKRKTVTYNKIIDNA